MAISLWGVFTMSHEIHFHSSYVAIPFVLCISEEKNPQYKWQARMCRPVWLLLRQPRPFAALYNHSGLINFDALTAQTVGIWVLQADLSLLHGEKSHVELRLEKGGRRKQSLRAALTRALHVALPQHWLLFCLDKKIWDIFSLKPPDPRVPCCISSDSSSQCEHFLPSKITVLLLLVKIAWHTCHSSCTE